jgi:hypothetical protein
MKYLLIAAMLISATSVPMVSFAEQKIVFCSEEYMWRLFHETQIPVDLQRPELRRTEKTQILPGVIKSLELKNFTDGRELFADIVVITPLAGTFGE